MTIAQEIRRIEIASDLQRKGRHLQALIVLLDSKVPTYQCRPCGAQLEYEGQDHDCKCEFDKYSCE